MRPHRSKQSCLEAVRPLHIVPGITHKIELSGQDHLPEKNSTFVCFNLNDKT